MKSIKNIVEDQDQNRFEQKFAAVQAAFAGNDDAADIFDRAIDILKEAGVTDRNTLLDQAVTMTTEILEESGAAKQAQAIDYAALGRAAADVAHAAGITSQEMKTASAEQADATGRLLAHCLSAELLALSEQG